MGKKIIVGSFLGVVLLLLCVAAINYFGGLSDSGYEDAPIGALPSEDEGSSSDEPTKQNDESSNGSETAARPGDGAFTWISHASKRLKKLVSFADYTSTGQKGSVQVYNILANEKPRDGATLVFSSLELRLADNYIAGTTLSSDRKMVKAPNEGTYVTQSNGTVKFTPQKDFVGTAVGVGYTVRDTNGVSYQGKYKPRVVDTAPISCSDPRSQGFWLATKTGYLQGEEPGLSVKLQQLNAGGVDMSVSKNGQRYFLLDHDGNVMRSTDGGDNWQHVGPDVPQYGNLSYAVSGNGMVILMSFQTGYDYETEESIYEHYRSTDGGTSWQAVALPSPVASPYDDEDATLISESGDIMYHLEFQYAERQVNLSRSTDKGTSWVELAPVEAFNPNSYAMSDDGSRLFISAYVPEGANHVLIRSTDGGATWTQSDPTEDFVGNGELQVSDDGTNVVYITHRFSDDASPTYVSTDGGATWTERAMPGEGIRLEVFELSGDGQRLITSATDTLNDYQTLYFSSSDLGATWTQLTLPDMSYLRSLLVNQDGSTIYALGYDDTYVSNNAGASWSLMLPIYQPFNEYRVDLNLATAKSDYVLDKTATEGWMLTYDPVTDDLVATVTNEAIFVIPDEIVAEYTLAPLAGCAKAVKGTIHFKYESLG